MGFKVQHGFDDLRGEGGFVTQVERSPGPNSSSIHISLDLIFSFIEKSIVNIWSHSLF